ncbi:MAG: YtxH domain-containing protein [Nitrospirota bacterium]
MDQGNDYSIGMGAFLAGVLIGAGVALLLAPQSGAETRGMLRDYAGRAKDELKQRGQEVKSTLDRAMESGKEAFESAKERGKDFYGSGKEAIRDAGKDVMKNRG